MTTRSPSMAVAVAVAVLSAGTVVAQGQRPVIHDFEGTPESPVETGSQVVFTVTASDPQADPIEARFDFGDGTPQTEWDPALSVNHTFALAGIFPVLVQVRDPSNNIASAVLGYVVQEPAVGGPAARSSPIQIDEQTRRVWVVNPDHDSVSLFDADTLSGVVEIQLPMCSVPSSLALGDGEVWISCRDSDRVLAIDANTGEVLANVELPYGAAPEAIVLDASLDFALVAESGSGVVSRIDAVSRMRDAEIAVHSKPKALAIDGLGDELLVSHFVSPATGGRVSVVDPAALVALATIELELDTTSVDSGLEGRGLPNYLGGIAVSPSGNRAWVAGKKDNILRGEFREGNELNFETTARSLVAPLDLASRTDLPDENSDFDNRSLASSVTASPGGAHLFVTLTTNNEVAALNATTGAEVVSAETGFAPLGVTVDATTGRVFTLDFLSRSVSVFDAADLMASGADTLPLLANVPVTTDEPLSAEVLAGKIAFNDASDPRMAQDGYLSCAVCHLDGGEDGRVWDFTQVGEGLRNTTTLRGASGMGQGLVHWSGNFDEIQDFEHPIRDLFGGTGFLSDTEFNQGTTNQPLGDPKAGLSVVLDSLAAYLSSLDSVGRSPYREADGDLTTDGAAGRSLFLSLGCADCHGGDDFTDSALGARHDIGTLGPGSGDRLGLPLIGIDTPSLRGAWSTPPYLHDGSAAALEDVLLARNPLDLHGETSSLDAVEIDQLLAFLRQIDASEPAVPAPLTLHLTAPESQARFETGATVSLSVAGSLPITAVQYLVDDLPVASSNSPPFGAVWTAEDLGLHRVAALATRSDGATTLSAEVAVEVVPVGDCTWPDIVAIGGLQTGEATFSACVELRLEPGFDIAPAAVIDLEAGERVSIGSGVRVQSGGTLRARVDPGLDP